MVVAGGGGVNNIAEQIRYPGRNLFVDGSLKQLELLTFKPKTGFYR